MKIKVEEIKKIDRENSRLKGMVKLSIDDQFIVNDIRIIEGNKGLFIAMPAVKMFDGKYKDIFHPINSDVEKEISEIIIKKYNEFLEKEEV